MDDTPVQVLSPAPAGLIVAAPGPVQAIRIGLMSEKALMRLWGKAVRQHGFGSHMPYEFANTLYLALLTEERSRRELPLQPLHQANQNAQTVWRTQVGTIRDQLGHRFEDYFLSSVLTRYLPHLRHQRILRHLSVEAISSDVQLTLGTRQPRQARWRYATFVNIVWYGLAPHLETREMLDPNGVWRRLNKMVADLHRLDSRFWNVSRRRRRIERINFALAIYEGTYRLLAEISPTNGRYQRTIANRAPFGCLNTDPILALPDGPAVTLQEALVVRQAAYEELLQHTLVNCYCHMLANSPDD